MSMSSLPPPDLCITGPCIWPQAPAGARSAFAQQTVVMNTPPFGGSFAVSPTTGFELNSTFVLRASYWVDDADDLPLRYSFSFYAVNETDAALVRRGIWLRTIVASRPR